MSSTRNLDILFLHQQLRSLITVSNEPNGDPVICYCSRAAFSPPSISGKNICRPYAVRTAPIVENFQSDAYHERTIYGSSAPHSIQSGPRNIIAYGSGTFAGKAYRGIVGFANHSDTEFTEFPLGTGLINHISLGASRSGSAIAVASSNDSHIYTGVINDSAEFKLLGKTKLGMSNNATASQPSGPLLAVAGDSSSVLLLRAPGSDNCCRNKRLSTIQALRAGLGVAFSKCGRYLAAVGNGLYIWDLRNLNKACKILSPNHCLFNVLWTNDGSVVVSQRFSVQILKAGETKLETISQCPHHQEFECDCRSLDPLKDGIVGLEFLESNNSLIVAYTNGLSEIPIE